MSERHQQRRQSESHQYHHICISRVLRDNGHNSTQHRVCVCVCRQQCSTYPGISTHTHTNLSTNRKRSALALPRASPRSAGPLLSSSSASTSSSSAATGGVYIGAHALYIAGGNGPATMPALSFAASLHSLARSPSAVRRSLSHTLSGAGSLVPAGAPLSANSVAHFLSYKDSLSEGIPLNLDIYQALLGSSISLPCLTCT